MAIHSNTRVNCLDNNVPVYVLYNFLGSSSFHFAFVCFCPFVVVFLSFFLLFSWQVHFFQLPRHAPLPSLCSRQQLVYANSLFFEWITLYGSFRRVFGF